MSTHRERAESMLIAAVAIAAKDSMRVGSLDMTAITRAVRDFIADTGLETCSHHPTADHELQCLACAEQQDYADGYYWYKSIEDNDPVSSEDWAIVQIHKGSVCVADMSYRPSELTGKFVGPLSPQPMGEWKPIQDAPTDGSPILASDGRIIRLVYRTVGTEKSYLIPGNHPWLPTHWMRLPEPPSLMG